MAVVRKKAIKIKHNWLLFDLIVIWFIDAWAAIDADVHDLVAIEIDAINLALVMHEIYIYIYMYMCVCKSIILINNQSVIITTNLKNIIC